MLQETEVALLQQLKSLAGAPSVQYSSQAPRDSVMHGWREDRVAESKEDAAMDASADGAETGRQHAAEFFANNKYQDGTTMGIVRPKPTMSLNNNPHAPTATAAAAATPAAAAAKKSTAAPMDHPVERIRQQEVADLAATVIVDQRSHSRCSPLRGSECS